MKPIRLQLSRWKGFDLQALSRKYNGREAVNVARPSRWGNQFTVTEKFKAGTKVGGSYIAVPTVEDAVECFREMMKQHPDWCVEAAEELRGRNLACWCKPNSPCHADVLLEIANSDPVTDVTATQSALASHDSKTDEAAHS